ncbi:hypothetical protein B0H21DRAFT_416527 [Amylocystis lapponica]|nr:hypothetical protein B0H21DRAFT_416527 [Amylocystis lapponica]
MVDSADTNQKRRSVSRGREVFKSSGRGGSGNIRRPSVDTPPAVDPAEIARGRDAPARKASTDAERLSTGRGGVGNIQSTSRARGVSRAPEGSTLTASIVNQQESNLVEYERSVIRARQEAAKATKHSSGRGGQGNYTRKSRSGSRKPKPVHSTGRGGAGNVRSDSLDDAERDTLERVDSERAHEDGSFSLPGSPPQVRDGAGGGAGSVRSRSASKDSTPSQDKRSSRNSFGKIWNKVANSVQSEDDPESSDAAEGVGSPQQE